MSDELYNELLSKGFYPERKFQDDGYTKLLYIKNNAVENVRLTKEGNFNVPNIAIDNQNQSIKDVSTGTRVHLGYELPADWVCTGNVTPTIALRDEGYGINRSIKLTFKYLSLSTQLVTTETFNLLGVGTLDTLINNNANLVAFLSSKQLQITYSDFVITFNNVSDEYTYQIEILQVNGSRTIQLDVESANQNTSYVEVANNTIHFCLSETIPLFKKETVPVNLFVNFTDISYSPTLDRYVALGSDFGIITGGQPVVLYKDGNQPWQYLFRGQGVQTTMTRLTWADDKFVAFFRNDIHISQDGVNWTTYPAMFNSTNVPGNPSSVTIEDITYVAGYFYAAVRTTTTQWYTYRSTNALTWTLHKIYVAGERQTNWYASENEYIIHTFGINPTSAKRYVNGVMANLWPVTEVQGSYRNGRYLAAYKSGTNWRACVTTVPEYVIEVFRATVASPVLMMLAGMNSMLAANGNYIYRSSDEGYTWEDLRPLVGSTNGTVKIRYLKDKYWLVGTSNLLMSVAD